MALLMPRAGFARALQRFFRHAASLGSLLILLAACHSANAFDSTQLVGHWYGEIARDGQQHRFLINRLPSGSFAMDYRIYLDGALMVSRVQAGEWALKEDTTYWTRTTKITDETGSYAPPTATGYYEDLYTVISVNAAEIKTRHQKSGNETTVKRVADDFVLQ